jgi:hypothetical protein
MGVAINQIDYDDFAAADADGLGFDTNLGMKFGPVSQRIGCRARMGAGVNTDWWWRPGAPLALVLDTITPALVYKLPEPITLSPGDTLSVEADVPGTNYFDSELASITGETDSRVQLGVSFNGYTAIEG